MNLAKKYCNFLETESKMTEIEFLKVIQAHLIELYSFGRNLPSVHLQTCKDFENDIDDNAMKSLLKFTGDRVPFSYYWTVLNAIDMNNLVETGAGDLIDDLGDIYKDLKCVLMIFDTIDSAAKENAIWKFKADFDYHWGDHCIEALSAIHHYLAKNR